MTKDLKATEEFLKENCLDIKNQVGDLMQLVQEEDKVKYCFNFELSEFYKIISTQTDQFTNEVYYFQPTVRESFLN